MVFYLRYNNIFSPDCSDFRARFTTRGGHLYCTGDQMFEYIHGSQAECYQHDDFKCNMVSSNAAHHKRVSIHASFRETRNENDHHWNIKKSLVYICGSRAKCCQHGDFKCSLVSSNVAHRLGSRTEAVGPYAWSEPPSGGVSGSEVSGIVGYSSKLDCSPSTHAHAFSVLHGQASTERHNWRKYMPQQCYVLVVLMYKRL